MNKFKAYVLKDPNSNIPRYVGITSQDIKTRLSQHLQDVKSRPNLNKHKTAWIKKLAKNNQIPIIEEIANFDNLEETKQFEVDYIKQYKEQYKLINQTIGGDHLGFRSHSRESFLKKKTTKAIVQYNILGEKIAEFEMIEDAVKLYKFKSGAHITQCCKHIRSNAYGYIWRYKNEELGDISDIDPMAMAFNKLIQYDLDGNKLEEYNSYMEASQKIGDKSKGSNIIVSIKQNTTCKGFKFQLEPIYIYYDQNLYNQRIMDSKFIDKSRFKKGVRKINKYDLDHNYICTYNSLSEAALEVTGIVRNRMKINKCCKTKQIYYNFLWEYV